MSRHIIFACLLFTLGLSTVAATVGSFSTLCPCANEAEVSLDGTEDIFILNPEPRTTVSGLVNVTWMTTHPNSLNLTYIVSVAPELTMEWVNVGWVQGSFFFQWDTTEVEDGLYFLRIVAVQGETIFSAITSQPVHVLNFHPTEDGMKLMVGYPYPIFDLKPADNTSFYLHLYQGKTYTVITYGEYTKGTVDLNVYLFNNQTTDISQTFLQSQPRSLSHVFGSPDMFEVTINQTDTYRILIHNNQYYSDKSATAKILVLENWDVEETSQQQTSLNVSTTHDFQPSQFRTYYLKPSRFSDLNISGTLSLGPSLVSGVSLFPFLTVGDLESYKPLEGSPLSWSSSEEGEDIHFTYLLAKNKETLDLPGIVLVVLGLSGQGEVQINTLSTDYYAPSSLLASGHFQWVDVTENQTTLDLLMVAGHNYSLFAQTLVEEFDWDLFLFDQNHSELLDYNVEFTRNGTQITGFNAPYTGRYIVQLTRDTSANVMLNSSSRYVWMFLTEELNDPNTDFSLVMNRGEFNSTPLVNTHKSILVSVKNHQKQTFRVTLISSSNLMIGATIVPFTIAKDYFSYNQSIYEQESVQREVQNRKGGRLILEHTVGLRGFESTVDEFWIISVEALWGEGEVTLTYQFSSSEEDLYRMSSLTLGFLVLLSSLLITYFFERRF